MQAIKTAEYLAQEYLFLQKTVEDFDARTLTIKAWSVTFSAAGLGFAYEQHNANLLLVAAGSAIVFWLVEATWKYNQRAYYHPRLFEIEEWFASQGDKDGTKPFQITSKWKNEFAGWTGNWIYTKKGDPWWKALGIPFFFGVMMPHVVVFAVGLFLYFNASPEKMISQEIAKSGPSALVGEQVQEP